MPKRRTKVPDSVVARVMFASDLRCCVCYAKGHQLHHLDGDPNNHEYDNLAYLCLDHHDEATRTGGLSRKLSSATIVTFRADWYTKVEHRREADTHVHPGEGQLAISDERFHELMLEALQVHEVRKVRFEMSSFGWADMDPLLRKVAPYADEASTRIRAEILDALQSVAVRARTGMTRAVAVAVSQLVSVTVPTWGLVARRSRPTPPEDIALLEQGADIGAGLAYDGAKYLRDLKIVDAGSGILWQILRYVHLNNLDGPKEHCLEEFDSALSGAKESKPAFDDAIRLLAFKRADALAVGKTARPQYPDDLVDKLRR